MPTLEPLHINLLSIAGAVVALVIAFAIAGWILGRLLRVLASVPAMNRFEGPIDVVRTNLRLLLMLACVLASVGAIGGGAWLMYQEEIIWEYLLAQVRSIPPEFWMDLGIGLGKSIGLAIAAAIVLRWVRRALDALCAKAKAFEGIKANDESIEQLFTTLRNTVRRASWLYVLALSVTFVGLPLVVHEFLLLLIRVYLIIAAGVLASRSLDAVIASLDALSRKYSSKKNLMRYYDQLSPLVPALRRAVELVIYLFVATVVVGQIAAIASLAEWGPRLIKVIGYVFASRVVVELANLFVDEAFVRRADLTEDQKKRRMTMVPLFKSIIKYIVYFGTGVFIIKQLGFDPTPVLAGAGILGLAVGLGAQNLISDMVSGFFILFENYYLVGDYIRAGEAEGVVESIDMRATRIRDHAGRLHIVRNGKIDELINYSKEYTFAVVEVGVAYDSDLSEVVAALEDAGQRMFDAHEDVLEPVQVLGLDNFGESELTYRTVTKVKPGRHKAIEREMRRVIKDVFDEQGIEIPFARRVLIFENADGDPVAPPVAPA